tara:strand:+ start:360 stop:572 length:213 start_codon:yes stop_codon:yes gene_type:complete
MFENTFNFASAQYISGTGIDGNPLINNVVKAVHANGAQALIPAEVGNEEYDHLLARHNDPDDSFTIADAD